MSTHAGGRKERRGCHARVERVYFWGVSFRTDGRGGPSGHMVRKLVDSTNVCLKRQGRTPRHEYHLGFFTSLGAFSESRREVEEVEEGWVDEWRESSRGSLICVRL